MMTLEEAIIHAEEAANTYEDMMDDYALDSKKLHKCANEHRQLAEWLRELQERRDVPEIVHCKDCRKHNQSYGDNGAIDSCPLILYRGKAQGHEFDYQFCVYAERKSDD